MTEERNSPEQRRACLSALMDGDDAALTAGCAAWRDDADARAQWHAYHLIGDVLRSDELASRPAADAAFLRALRVKLGAEPVVLAPAAPETPQRARRWLAPAAVAAGVAAVAGTLVVTAGLWQADPSAPVLASSPTAAPGAVAVSTQPTPVAVVDPGKVIRDAQLDRYLRAHKQYGNSGALGLPGGVLQRASAVTPEAQAR